MNMILKNKRRACTGDTFVWLKAGKNLETDAEVTNFLQGGLD